MTVLHTEKMAVGYDKKVLIDGIEISVSAGEILTLIGPNGAGKSTILKSITRSLELIGGTVFVEDTSIHKMKENQLAKKISVMLTGRLEPELMTCREVVESGRFPYTGRFGMLSKNDREITEDSMQTVNVGELAERSFNCISDGQKQRVLLARAICQQPDILILDEPTSYLDIRHKLELLSLLKELVNRKNIAVVMSLHELDLAQRVSDKVVCVNGNRIDKIGTPEEVFTSEYINRLYGVKKGGYDGTFGTIELEKPSGNAKVFVIGGNGSGIPVYRQLQRMNIPFCTGVLHENDIDCSAANMLAECVITERAFEPVSDMAYDRALECLKKCGAVICTVESFGTMNAANERLKIFAQQNGMLLGADWKNRYRNIL